MNIKHKSRLWMAALLGALLVSAMVISLAVAGQVKYDVCHVTNVPSEGDGHIINIAEPGWDAHEAHGDKIIDPVSSVTDNGDGTCHVSVAVDDVVTTPVDTAVEINVLANDTYSDPVFVSVQEFPQYGILGIVDVGIFEYTPNTGFTGTDSFTYKITDTEGLFDTATVTIDVGP